MRREFKVFRLLGIGIVFVNNHRRSIRRAFHQQFHIGSFVGFHRYGLFIFVRERLVSIGFHFESVIARLKSLENKNTVVKFVHLIGLHGFISFLEQNFCPVHRQPLVIGIGSIVKKIISYLFVHIFYRTHDITCLLRRKLKVIADAASHSHAFLSAIIFIKSTMSRRLIGMEKTFYETSRHTMH